MIYYTYAKTDQFLKKKNLYLKCNMRLCFCIKYTLLLLLHNIYVVLTVNGFGCTLHERNSTHDTVPVPASERNTQLDYRKLHICELYSIWLYKDFLIS